MYHGAALFSLTFFNLMGATVSNVLEKIVTMLLVIVSSSSVFQGQGQGFFICHIIVIQGIIRSEM